LIMRKSDTQKLGEIIREYLEQMMIDKKLKEVSTIRAWEELMGKPVAERTRNIYVKNKVLFIELKSSVLRNELIMMRQTIIDKINERAGENIIEKMVVR
jgi:predicted nucleic acid-binding Zn ribbon protein